MPDILSYLRSFRHLIHLPDGDGELLQRFRVKRDELAFATLVQRHGPMVLGIAQRILGQSNLLDDVFQATFLVLARRGRHMETWPSVAGWLVQVARRTALQARAKAARRTRHEQQAAALTSNSITVEPAEVVSQRDLSRLLDAELARLPSKYRTPLVLCHLEGQTKEETARQLGWPVGSVSGRLARGKKLLQARLLRRGIVPALATSIFTMPTANAHLPSLLIQATTLLATNVVHQTSQASTGTAVVLAQGVMTSMFMTKVKYAASILLVLGLCLGTGAWAISGKGENSSTQDQSTTNGAKTQQPSDRVPNQITDYDRLEGIWRREERNPTTDELEVTFEMIFKNDKNKRNMYVERMFVRGKIREDPAQEYSLNEDALPKQLDLSITKASDLNSWYSGHLKNKDKYERDIFLSTLARDINQGKYVNRILAIYELKDNELKYVITGRLPFELANNEFVLNSKSPMNKRASSFATANGTVFTFKRVERSLKDTTDATPVGAKQGNPRQLPSGNSDSTSVPSPQLQDLRQQRLKLAQERMRLWDMGKTNGTRSYDELVEISQQLLEASLALANDTPVRILAMEEHLKILKQIEERAEEQVKRGMKTVDAQLAAKLRRIEFEIQLQELKEKR